MCRQKIMNIVDSVLVCAGFVSIIIIWLYL